MFIVVTRIFLLICDTIKIHRNKDIIKPKNHMSKQQIIIIDHIQNNLLYKIQGIILQLIILKNLFLELIDFAKKRCKMQEEKV